MMRTSVSYLFVMIIGSSVAIKECNRLGIYPSEDPEKFIVCTEKNGELIRVELACSNGTVYSGSNGKCTPKNFISLNVYNLFNGQSTSDTKVKINCKTPGVICSDCLTMTICIGDDEPDGSISVKNVTSIICKDGEHCATGVGCTKSTSAPCSLGSFQCDDIGVFPDPYDCKKFHVCSDKGTVLDNTCSSGSFDSRTASCGFSMNSLQCVSRPVPLCKQLMQIGALADNPTIYYICLTDTQSENTLRPSLHRCPGDLQFDEITFTCI